MKHNEQKQVTRTCECGTSYVVPANKADPGACKECLTVLREAFWTAMDSGE